MSEEYPIFSEELDRRSFLASVGKGVGLAALSSVAIDSLLNEIYAASQTVDHKPPLEVASDEDYWSEIQRAFSITRSITNLNNGGVSPSPRIVTEALIRYQWQQEDVPPYMMWQILEPQSETIRVALARIFGCDPEEMAITRNASESLETLLLGIDLNDGDEVLTTTQDYPRMLTTLRQREMRQKIRLNLIKIPIAPNDPLSIVEAFKKSITKKTRMILVSHMVFLTGQIIPIRPLCELGRSEGIEVVVDGAHSFAQFQFKQQDLQCDYFAASLHKWLHAPKGTGILYVRKDKIEKVWPLMAAEKKQANDIRKFEEIGTHSAAPRLAIGEAILFYEGIGAARKEGRLRFLSRYWMNALKDLSGVRFNTSFDDQQSCALANVALEGVDPNALVSFLFNKHKILTTPIVHDEFSGIRITPSVYTTIAELDRFCEVMRTVATKGLPKS